MYVLGCWCGVRKGKRKKAMSIVFDRNNSTATNNSSYNHDLDRRIGRSGFGAHKMTCLSIYSDDSSGGNSPPEFGGDERRPPKVVVEERGHDSSSSTSSIGRNSDDSPAERSSAGDGVGEEEEEEVQSQLKSGAFDNLEALEEVLPMKYVVSSVILL